MTKRIPPGKNLSQNRNKGLFYLAATGFTLISFLFSTCSSKEDLPGESSARIDENPAQIIGIGRIEPEARILDLASETSGIVTEIHFPPGSTLSKGQILLEINSSVEKARLEQVAARIETQKSQIKSAEAALSSTRIKAENAGVSFQRAKKLYEQEAESEFRYDQAKADFESLTEEVKRLEAEVVSAKNLLKLYFADLRLAQAELERKRVRAPADGRLLSLDITLGSLVTPQKVFGAFAPKSPIIARCEIDELFASSVKVGQRAYVRNQGMTESLAEGKVSFTGPFLRKKSIFADEVGDLEDRRVREVWITLEPETELLYGTRVECVILLEE